MYGCESPATPVVGPQHPDDTRHRPLQRSTKQVSFRRCAGGRACVAAVAPRRGQAWKPTTVQRIVAHSVPSTTSATYLPAVFRVQVAPLATHTSRVFSIVCPVAPNARQRSSALYATLHTAQARCFDRRTLCGSQHARRGMRVELLQVCSVVLPFYSAMDYGGSGPAAAGARPCGGGRGTERALRRSVNDGYAKGESGTSTFDQQLMAMVCQSL